MKRPRKGVSINTSKFTGDALSYVQRIKKKIELLDGLQLGETLIKYDLSVAIRIPIR